MSAFALRHSIRNANDANKVRCEDPCRKAWTTTNSAASAFPNRPLGTVPINRNSKQFKLLHDAEIDIEFALNCDPSNPDAHALKALNQMLRGERTENTSSELELALKLDPKHLRSIFYFGVDYLNRKEYEKASEQFKRAVDLDSQYVDALIGLGEAYSNLEGRYAKAEIHLSKANEISINNSLILYNLGWLNYGKLERIKQALVYFKQAHKCNPDDGPINYFMACCHMEEGNYECAVDSLKKATEKMGDTGKIKQLRLKIERSRP